MYDRVGGAGGQRGLAAPWRPHTFREMVVFKCHCATCFHEWGAGADQRLSALSQHGGPGRRLTDDDEHAEARQRLEPSTTCGSRSR